MNKKRNKIRAQQEMVGFVLIVVLVVVAAMVFFVISLRATPEIAQSGRVESLINSILSYTTNCAVVYEPDYDTIEDLIVSCYENSRCSNLNKNACEHLNETLSNIMDDIMASESSYNSYKLDVLVRSENNDENELIESLENGQCTGKITRAQKLIKLDFGNAVLRITLCG